MARRGRRGKTIPTRRLSSFERWEMKEDLLEAGSPTPPKTRGDCERGERPCPWVRCKFHLYLDVNPETGSIKLNFPDLEVWELPESCALDVADRGGAILEDIGGLINLTRERIRQVEEQAKAKLAPLGERFRDLVGEDIPGWRNRG
jgi:hypothetical protein